MLSRWYRTGVIYSLDIGLFQDANGDGIGDIQGLISRLDYLADLRVTTIWLNPIHPSPRRTAGRTSPNISGCTWVQPSQAVAGPAPPPTSGSVIETARS
jgi:glycosidase